MYYCILCTYNTILRREKSKADDVEGWRGTYDEFLFLFFSFLSAT